MELTRVNEFATKMLHSETFHLERPMVVMLKLVLILRWSLFFRLLNIENTMCIMLKRLCYSKVVTNFGYTVLEIFFIHVIQCSAPCILEYLLRHKNMVLN